MEPKKVTMAKGIGHSRTFKKGIQDKGNLNGKGKEKKLGLRIFQRRWWKREKESKEMEPGESIRGSVWDQCNVPLSFVNLQPIFKFTTYL